MSLRGKKTKPLGRLRTNKTKSRAKTLVFVSKKRQTRKSTGHSLLPEGINPLNMEPYSEKYYQIKAVTDQYPMNQPSNVKTLLSSIASNQVTLLSAATGSGKTTSIGRHMLSYLRVLYGELANILITQPRQAPARFIAERVADELDVPIRQQVGYVYKNSNMTSEATRVTFMTEGILMRIFMQDPLAQQYKAIIIDEAHERSVETDLILLFLKNLIKSGLRKDLRVVIMSATADIASFAKYFEDVTEVGNVEVEGRTHPVKVNYHTSSPADYVPAAVERVIKICSASKQPKGDILVFLSGKRDLKEACQMLTDRIKGTKISLKCFEFSSDMDSAEQDLVQKQPGHYFGVERKVVMATNVAEASITIDGIVFVIDSGRANLSGFDPKTNHKTLDNDWVSKAAIRQRLGRAGRTRPGIAYCLYTKQKFEELDDFATPAIRREELTDYCLRLLTIKDIGSFVALRKIMQDMISPPRAASMDVAQHHLALLGAVDKEGVLTSIGQQMSQFPTSVEFARSILFSPSYGVSREILKITAMTSTAGPKVEDFVFLRNVPDRLIHPGGEVFGLLNIYNETEGKETEELRHFCSENGLIFRHIREARRTYQRLRRILDRILPDRVRFSYGRSLVVDVAAFSTMWLTTPIEGEVGERVVKCLLQGFFSNVVMRRDGDFFAIGTDSKVRVKGVSKDVDLAFYIDILRINKRYVASGVTIVADPVWFLDAAQHYLPEIHKRHQLATLKQAEKRRREALGESLKGKEVMFQRK